MEKIKVCAKKFSVWAKSAAGIISICLFIISIALLGLGCSPWGNFSERTANNINNILFGLGTNLLGIIVTVSFVQFFLDRQDKKVKQQCERDKILRFDRIMQIHIRRYIVYFNTVTTPMDQRGQISDHKLKGEFTFCDLKDLYQQSLLLRDKSYTPAIQLFYDAEMELRKYCIECIAQIDFQYYPELLDNVTQFIEISLGLDMRSAVLGNMQLVIGKGGEQKKYIDVIRDYISDTSKDWVSIIHDAKTTSSMMAPYVHLFDMLTYEKACIEVYQAHIALLKEEKL